MKRFMIAAIFLISFSVAGCAINPERISKQADLDVCQSYGVFAKSPFWSAAAENYKQEIIRRKLLSDEESELVREKKIRQGMSQCALYASWGNPDRENRSIGSWGVHIQHVYNSGYRYIRPTYVYTQNGKVTSWQD